MNRVEDAFKARFFICSRLDPQVEMVPGHHHTFIAGRTLTSYIAMGQTLSLHLALEKFSLKPVNRAFIAAEGLDLITTFMGSIIFPQVWEANPMKSMLGGWIPLILAKIIATILVVTILQRVQKWPVLVWIIPTAAFLPVLWNIICILFELVV